MKKFMSGIVTFVKTAMQSWYFLSLTRKIQHGMKEIILFVVFLHRYVNSAFLDLLLARMDKLC